jgi:hypothetical protein
MYIVKCQPTERPVVYYFSGLSDTGEVLYSNFLARACRYPTITDAEKWLKPLFYSRGIVKYIIEPEELNL